MKLNNNQKQTLHKYYSEVEAENLIKDLGKVKQNILFEKDGNPIPFEELDKKIKKALSKVKEKSDSTDKKKKISTEIKDYLSEHSKVKEELSNLSAEEWEGIADQLKEKAKLKRQAEKKIQEAEELLKQSQL